MIAEGKPLKIVDAGARTLRRAVRETNLARREKLTRAGFQFTADQDAFIRRYYDRNVRGRAQAIADRLGLPKWRITRRAAELGLSRVKEKRWSVYEIQKLESLIAFTSIAKLSKLLGRSPIAITLKAKRLGIQKRRHGYTASSLALALGVDSKWVTGRIQGGRIRAIRRETRRSARQGDEYLISERDVLEYLKANPYDVDLRKVDGYWFMDLIANHLEVPN